MHFIMMEIGTSGSFDSTIYETLRAFSHPICNNCCYNLRAFLIHAPPANSWRPKALREQNPAIMICSSQFYFCTTHFPHQSSLEYKNILYAEGKIVTDRIFFVRFMYLPAKLCEFSCRMK